LTNGKLIRFKGSGKNLNEKTDCSEMKNGRNLKHIRQRWSKIIGYQEKPFGEDDDDKISG